MGALPSGTSTGWASHPAHDGVWSRCPTERAFHLLPRHGSRTRSIRVGVGVGGGRREPGVLGLSAPVPTPPASGCRPQRPASQHDPVRRDSTTSSRRGCIEEPTASELRSLPPARGFPDGGCFGDGADAWRLPGRAAAIQSPRGFRHRPRSRVVPPEVGTVVGRLERRVMGLQKGTSRFPPRAACVRVWSSPR